MRTITIISVITLFVIFTLILRTSYAGYDYQKPKAVRLHEVTTLTFNKNDMTTSRRSTPVPQLKCTSGPCQYAPSTAMCRNIGWDGADVQWQCEAELPKGIKLGKVAVSCEGFTHPDDELVLIGSCGLEYELTGTAPVFKSEYKPAPSYARRILDWLNSWTLPVAWAYGHKHHSSYYEDYHRPHEQSFLSTIITYGAIAVIAYVVYRMMCPTRNVVYVPPNSSYSSSLPFGLSSLLSWFNQPSMFSSPAAPGGPQYDAYPKTYSQQHYGQQPSYQAPSTTSSFIPNLLSGVAGYWLGSRSAARATPAETHHTYATPPIHTAQSYAPPAYNPDFDRTRTSQLDREEIRGAHVNDLGSSRSMNEDKSKTTQTSTAYGTTKRR